MSSPISIPRGRRRAASGSEASPTKSLWIAQSSPADLETMVDILYDEPVATRSFTSSSPPGNRIAMSESSLPDSAASSDWATQSDPEDIDALNAVNAGLITSETAQKWFPPEACLFVANLRISCADHDLKRAIHKAFSLFGLCYVKIRRDPSNLPIAFVQFTMSADAEKAAREGREISIAGLTVRIERAKCDRTIFCSPHASYGFPSKVEGDILDLLTPHGRIEEIRRITAAERLNNDLNDGFLVRFRHYGCCQDALKAVQSHPDFDFSLVNVNEDSQQHEIRQRRMPAKPIPLVGRRSRRTGYVQQLSRCGSVIAVEGLPVGSHVSQLKDIFYEFGTIVKVLISHEVMTFGEQEVSYRVGHIFFQEAMAGWAATACSSQYGLNIQDPLQLVYSQVDVKLTHLNTQAPWNIPRVSKVIQQYRTQTSSSQYSPTKPQSGVSFYFNSQHHSSYLNAGHQWYGSESASSSGANGATSDHFSPTDSSFSSFGDGVSL